MLFHIGQCLGRQALERLAPFVVGEEHRDGAAGLERRRISSPKRAVHDRCFEIGGRIEEESVGAGLHSQLGSEPVAQREETRFESG